MNRAIVLRAFTLTLLLAVMGADQAAAQVMGRVLDARTGSGVTAAVVRLVGARSEQALMTGAGGAYRFPALAAGEYVVTVSHPGYDSTRVHVIVRGGAPVTLDMQLEPRALPMPRLLVDTERITAGGAAAAGVTGDSLEVRLAAQRFLSLGPQTTGALGQLVMSETLRGPPPDQPGGPRPHALYIWGSSAERGRVLLDGATLNAPLHLGAILPPLDPELLGRAELRTAGISPRYDGGTAYIMDFGTRPADARVARTSGAIDLLSSTATLELPVSEHAGVLAGGRRVNSELVESVAGRRFGYGYMDVLGRADARAGGTRATVTAIRTREAVRLPRDQGEDEAAWQNMAVSASLRGDGTARRVANMSFSRGTADLPLLSAPGGHLRGSADRFAASFEQRAAVGAGTALVLGTEFEHLRFERRSSADRDPLEPERSGPVACTTLLPCTAASVALLATYAEAAWQPWSRGAARAGLRAAWEPGAGRVHLLPRLSLTALNGGTRSVTLAGGRFSQAVSDAGAADSSFTGIAHATQLELSVAQRSGRSALAASAFLRHHERHGSLQALTAPGAELSFGSAAGPVALTLGYSLLGRRRADGETGIDYQQLAAASAGAAHGRMRLDVSAAWGRGLPLTSIVLERAFVPTKPPVEITDLDAERAYVRVDALLSGEWTVLRDGRTFSIMPYVKLVNGLSRREALFYFHDGSGRNDAQPLGALPALPVIGVRWHF